MGYTAIALALLGGRRPSGAVVAALLYGALSTGALNMVVATGIPLALLSVIGGAFNLPHWLPGANGLHHFMEPVFEYGKVEFPEGGAMEYILMALTLAGIAASVGTAWLFYVKDPARPKAIADKFKALYEGSLNKWYVDELYELVLLTPIVTVSRQVLWAIVDAQIIDGLVNGAASAAQSAGRRSRVARC